MRVSSEEGLDPIVNVIRNEEPGKLAKDCTVNDESNALEKSNTITMTYDGVEELDECTGGGASRPEGKLIGHDQRRSPGGGIEGRGRCDH